MEINAMNLLAMKTRVNQLTTRILLKTMRECLYKLKSRMKLSKKSQLRN